MRLSAVSVFVVSPVLLALAGCSGTTLPAGSTGGTTTTTTSGATTTTTSGASSTSGTTTTLFDAGATVTSYQTGLGPVSLVPGQEQTNCIVVSLGNTEGGYVRRFRADLTPGSHHMIVYASSDTTESPTPTPCQPLAGILMGEHPLFIAQQAQAELVFPTADDGTPVAFQIAANQMVKIELHAINTTMAPLMVTGSAYLDTVPLSTQVTVSDLAFWGTKNINIPPNGSFDTGVLYQAAIPGTKSFALTTHQHQLGTEMRVWYSTGVTDTSDLVADGKDWSNPPLVMLAPPLDFPSDGSKGLAYDCHWVNTTTRAVKFGESFYNEMCFLWHYYYPSKGFQMCLDGLCG
jgi:hypothetical protein